MRRRPSRSKQTTLFINPWVFGLGRNYAGTCLSTAVFAVPWATALSDGLPTVTRSPDRSSSVPPGSQSVCSDALRGRWSRGRELLRTFVVMGIGIRLASDEICPAKSSKTGWRIASFDLELSSVAN
jgi:hypothetical protein